MKHQRSIRDDDAVSRKIEGEGADDHGRRFIALASPQIGANARHQLIEIEGLGEIIIGARVEPFDALVDRIEGGQHQNAARRLTLADVWNQRQSVAVRQPAIEKSDGIGIIVQCALGVPDRGNAVDDKSGVLDLLGDLPRELLVILDQ